MADSAASAATTEPSVAAASSAEDIENQENENSENNLVETESHEDTEMEVDASEEGACVLDVRVENQEKESSNEDVPAVAEEDGDKVLSNSEQNSSQVQTEPEQNGNTNRVDTTDVSQTVKTEAETKSLEVPFPEDEIKSKEYLEDEDVDSYMVLEEADGDDNESTVSEDEELTENEQLRKANLELNERLALLEEFIEVEFSEKFAKFIKKRVHLVDVMGLGKKDSDPKCNGKRSSKSMELVGLLKLVNDQAKNGTGRSPRKNYDRGNSSSANLTASSKPKNSVSASKDTPSSKIDEPGSEPKAKAKRCHRCHVIGHLVRDCPLPIELQDRKVILKKEKRREKKDRDRIEALQHPHLKNMKDRRRRISKALNRERQKLRMN